MASTSTFRESNLFGTPIRDLGLSIAGTRLEPIIRQFEAELRERGIVRLRPRFHLSTEWGVPFGTVVIGIPFYLAHPDLTELHGERVGHIEGFNTADILRYLRHEMGHVVNYAYKLYDEEEWVKAFGSITQPYVEDYRPQPFSRRFVRHLPGWYGQKHPDEDWSETFAVWMTPGRDWRKDYEHWPTALAKLEYCERTMARVNQRDPLVTAVELDEDVGEVAYSLEQYYQNVPTEAEPAGLDGALRAIFEDLAPEEPALDGSPQRSEADKRAEAEKRGEMRPAGPLIRRLERQLMSEVFRWTGHFPEKTRTLMRHLAQRADALQQVYPSRAENEAIIEVTILVTSLAMNHVHRGSYFPEQQPPAGSVAGPPAALSPPPSPPPQQPAAPAAAPPNSPTAPAPTTPPAVSPANPSPSSLGTSSSAAS